ncbi:cell wall anchor domain-containing protein, partial [Listeria floridensis FSL S10-1187]
SGMEKFVFKKTDKVEVVGVDSRYVEQARKPVTVVGNDVMDYDLTVQQNPYVIGTSTSLTGTYGDDISKVRLFVNGKVVAQATTDSNGNYTFATAAQFITSSTDTVKVVGVDSAYVQRAEKPVTVQGNVQYDYSLSADPYKLNQANLTGKYGKDIFKVRLVVNGTIVRQAEMDGNGNFTFPNVATFIQPGDTVELVG